MAPCGGSRPDSGSCGATGCGTQCSWWRWPQVWSPQGQARSARPHLTGLQSSRTSSSPPTAPAPTGFGRVGGRRRHHRDYRRRRRRRTTGSDSGSAYVYTEQPDGTWAFTTKLTAPDAAPRRLLRQVGGHRRHHRRHRRHPATTTTPGPPRGRRTCSPSSPTAPGHFTTKLTAPDAAPRRLLRQVGGHRRHHRRHRRHPATTTTGPGSPGRRTCTPSSPTAPGHFTTKLDRPRRRQPATLFGALGSDRRHHPPSSAPTSTTTTGTGSGSAYVYTEQPDGTWALTTKLDRPRRRQRRLLRQSRLPSTAPPPSSAPYLNDDNGSGSGSAYVVHRAARRHLGTSPPNSTAPDAAAERPVRPESVAVDGTAAVIGATGDDDNGSRSGSAYVYTEQPDGTWAFTTKLVAPQTAPPATCFGELGSDRRAPPPSSALSQRRRQRRFFVGVGLRVRRRSQIL